MRLAEKKLINVREMLAKSPISSELEDWEMYKSYTEFWLQPPVYLDGKWQGGESMHIRRDGMNEFKIMCRPIMTLEQAAKYIEEILDRYNWPYIRSEPWEHPFDYQI